MHVGVLTAPIILVLAIIILSLCCGCYYYRRYNDAKKKKQATSSSIYMYESEIESPMSALSKGGMELVENPLLVTSKQTAAELSVGNNKIKNVAPAKTWVDSAETNEVSATLNKEYELNGIEDGVDAEESECDEDVVLSDESTSPLNVKRSTALFGYDDIYENNTANKNSLGATATDKKPLTRLKDTKHGVRMSEIIKEDVLNEAQLYEEFQQYCKG